MALLYRVFIETQLLDLAQHQRAASSVVGLAVVLLDLLLELGDFVEAEFDLSWVQQLLIDRLSCPSRSFVLLAID